MTELIVRLTASVALVFSFSLVGSAQVPSAREKLLTSEGNRKVSARFNEALVLPMDDPELEVYRITFIPTFYNPIKVRVENQKNGDITLVAKRLDGQGGYDAGKLKTEKKRKLTTKEWNLLLDLLNAAGFWQLPFVDKESEPDEKGAMTICLDGSEWTIEAVKNSNYHAVSRYCSEDKTFQAIGLYLAKLSGLKIKERELY